MADTYHQNSTMPQGNNTYSQGAQDYEQAQHYSQGQQQGGYENQPQNYVQENYAYNQNPSQNYNEGQNYPQQQNHAINGSNQAGNGEYYQEPQNDAYQQQHQQTSGMNGQAGRPGATYPDSKAPDMVHMWLDRIEKKFGGDRFDEVKHPENAAKNRALNESIIKKLTQVMKIVAQRGPALAMQYGSKFF